MRTPLIAFLTVAAALAAPAAASADSIVYINSGNVWTMAPDGSGKVQLTQGGDWHSPTQADNGTIAAVQGVGPIQVMARDGRPIRSITTKPAGSSNGGTFAPRPVNLSFSPDGSKIAYSYVQYICPPAAPCGNRESTFYTRADVTEATAQSTWGNQYSASNPEWLNNNRVLVSNADKVGIDDLDADDGNFATWMNPIEDIDDAEISRDGKRMASTFYQGPDRVLAFWTVPGDARTEVPGQPTAVCTSEPGQLVPDPSWSPDGSSIVASDTQGMWVIRFTQFGGGTCATAPSKKVAESGGQPDWGPANPPARRYNAPVKPGGGGTTPPRGGGSSGGPAPVVAPKLSFLAPKVTRAALRKGLKVKVTAPEAGKVTVKLTAKGRKVASGKVTAKRAGAVTVRLSKVKAGKAARIKGKLKLTVSAGGSKKSRSVRVR